MSIEILSTRSQVVGPLRHITILANTRNSRCRRRFVIYPPDLSSQISVGVQVGFNIEGTHWSHHDGVRTKRAFFFRHSNGISIFPTRGELRSGCKSNHEATEVHPAVPPATTSPSRISRWLCGCVAAIVFGTTPSENRTFCRLQLKGE